MEISPESGFKIPAIRLSNVVFPEPLSPRNATCDFSPTENSATSMTLWMEPSGARKDFFNSEISSNGMVVLI